ncbi:MAG: sulfite exporter TauE/SafE family protein [Marivita sp.]|nr:sulfite exporter TauE/SafE family protein [Marivita sp.]MCI5109760.1 sulfite exporter TauE/SafE family protein [Marivita sp.]
MLTPIILTLAGLGAGALNAIAGGGTFLTFPALVWAGIPPIMANATATFAALPGYAGSAWAYREDIETDGRPSLRRLILTSIAGGLIGAGLLLVTPEDLFSGVVPWLLLIATVAFAAGPWLARLAARSGQHMSESGALGLIFTVSVYGGYFNGGLGIMLLAAFGVVGMNNLHRMNGLKNLMSGILSVVAVLTYTIAGLIDWSGLIIVGVSCAIGGHLGAALARRIQNTAVLRGFIVSIGLTMVLIFFVRSLG